METMRGFMFRSTIIVILLIVFFLAREVHLPLNQLTEQQVRAILDRLFTAWNVVRLNAVDSAESSASEASTCDTNADGDAA